MTCDPLKDIMGDPIIFDLYGEIHQNTKGVQVISGAMALICR